MIHKDDFFKSIIDLEYKLHIFNMNHQKIKGNRMYRILEHNKHHLIKNKYNVEQIKLFFQLRNDIFHSNIIRSDTDTNFLFIFWEFNFKIESFSMYEKEFINKLFFLKGDDLEICLDEKNKYYFNEDESDYMFKDKNKKQILNDLVYLFKEKNIIKNKLDILDHIWMIDNQKISIVSFFNNYSFNIN